MSQSPKSFSEAALGGAIGAGFGAAAVGAVVASFGGGEMLTAVRATLPWFAAGVTVIVGQFAVAGAICTLAIRQFGASGTRPVMVKSAARAGVRR